MYEESHQKWREKFYPFAFLASVIVNCTPRKSKKTYKPEDFMPKEKPKGKSINTMIENAKKLGLRVPKYKGHWIREDG